MRKIFYNELPKRGKYINWEKSINYIISFIYDDIEGEIEVVDYYKKNKKAFIKVKYENNIYSISTDNLKNCKIGKLFKIYKKKIISRYIYKIGDVITDVKSGKLEILEQIRMSNGRSTRKGYRYRCLICGNVDVIAENNLNEHNGCNVCCIPTQKVLKGYNDMWTTNPEQAKLLLNFNDGYRYTQSSDQFVDWKCSECDNIIKNKQINMINRQGLSCPNCSDNLPYSEKFVFKFLQQLLNNNFIYQLSKSTLKWCNNYRYDFCFKLNNEDYIIEAHGIQHYEESFKQIKGSRTLEEEQENDKNKKELALRNGVKGDNYIVINCKKSDINWIKDDIINSRLNNIFNLSKLNWLKCHEYACSNIIKIICILWTDGFNNVTKISDKLKLGKNAVRRYLKQGAKLGWCDYNSKEEVKKNNKNIGKRNEKQIICLNTKQIFNSIKEAAIHYNLKYTSEIGQCCQDNLKYANISQTGEYLQWQYYDEYLIKPKKLLSNEEINKVSKNKKAIICLNNNKIFKSLTIAGKENNINISSISACCQGKQNYAGKDPITGKKFKWMYYDEYIKQRKEIS